MSQQASDGMVQNMMDDLVALEDEVEQLRGELDEMAELRERVQRLEERTDMLRLIEEADQLNADQRRAALWQHCVRKAKQTPSEQIALDKRGVEDALHHPDIDRTTYYDYMRDIAEMTPEGVASYVSASESETGATELRVDLSGVDESVDATTLFEGGD